MEMLSGVTGLIVTLFLIIKFNGLITRSVETAEKAVEVGLNSVNVLAEVGEDTAKTYASVVTLKNAVTRAELIREAEELEIATQAELDAIFAPNNNKSEA